MVWEARSNLDWRVVMTNYKCFVCYVCKWQLILNFENDFVRWHLFVEGRRIAGCVFNKNWVTAIRQSHYTSRSSSVIQWNLEIFFCDEYIRLSLMQSTLGISYHCNPFLQFLCGKIFRNSSSLMQTNISLAENPDNYYN